MGFKDKLETVGIAACIALLIMIFMFFTVALIKWAKPDSDASCAYCHSKIGEDADVVILADGRRLHAECYMRHIEEDGNGKTNSEAS